MGFEGDHFPDVAGLPVFRINETKIEVINGEVHTLCGMSIFGQIVWQYVVIMTAAEHFAARERYHLASELLERALALAH